ncbi:MAG TPA: AAA family ATPase, partial [Conexibacter sp.]|nr:AAA family ATPase [Conexibacter sp.]
MLADDPLLARGAELDQLRGLLDDARRGAGRHLLIEGEAGIGKSSLLRELRAVAQRSGFATLAAKADPLATDVAFGVALELVEPLAATRGEERAALFAGAAELALPLLAPQRPAGDDAAAERFAHGTFRLLANAAARTPLLLLVDDVQWADRGSLRLLAHLAARLDGCQLALVTAVRRGEPAADPPGLERLRLEPPAELLQPAPLPLETIPRLAAAVGLPDTSEELCAACARVTGGNPLLLKTLLTELAQHDGDLDPATVAGGLPQVSRHVQAQLARLGPHATQLAQSGAVLGDGATLLQAARLAGLDLDTAAAAADQLLAGGILAQVDPLAFAHPIVRASLHDGLAPAMRARLHAAAARQLAGDRVDSERLAAHAVRALPTGDAQLVELLLTAAEQARARAVPESAVHYLRRALEEPPADWQRGGVLAQLGRAEAAAGMAEAAETLEQALTLQRAPAERAETLLWIGRARFALGALRDAAAAFDRGLDELGADGLTGGQPARRATDAVGAGAGAGTGVDGARGGEAGAGGVAGGGRNGDAAARVALHELTVELRAGFISAARFEMSLRPEAQRRLAPLLETPTDGTTRGERALLAEVGLELGIRSAPPADAIATAMRAWADGQILDELDAQGIVLSQIAATLTWSDAFAASELVLDAAVAHAERNGAVQQLATAA